MNEGNTVNEHILTPPEIEPAPGWIASRRAHLVRELSAPEGWTPGIPHRRGWRLAGLAAATTVVLAGAALAAARVNPIDWVRGGGTSEARFSVDVTQTVRWPAPPELVCDAPAAGEFGCAPARTGRWAYRLYYRVNPQPKFTRAFALAGIADLEQRGLLTQARAAEIRAQIGAVEDEFFAKMDVLFRLSASFDTHEVRPGVLLVPPDGVPQLVTCRPSGEGMACRDLRAAVVPVGAPIYGLQMNEDWVETPARPADRNAGAADLTAVFGRSLTAAEEQLLLTMYESLAPSEESGGR
jgi:hypothetical protein